MLLLLLFGLFVLFGGRKRGWLKGGVLEGGGWVGDGVFTEFTDNKYIYTRDGLSSGGVYRTYRKRNVYRRWGENWGRFYRVPCKINVFRGCCTSFRVRSERNFLCLS